MSRSRLTETQKTEISDELGITIGAEATARENGQVTKYLVTKALQQIPNEETFFHLF